KYKLKHADAGLNFVYTNLPASQALAYHKELLTTGFGDQFNQRPGAAATRRITSQGVELSSSFLTGARDSEWGVILIEARAPTAAPLVLTVEESGVTLAEVKLNLRISQVE